MKKTITKEMIDMITDPGMQLINKDGIRTNRVSMPVDCTDVWEEVEEELEELEV